MKACRLKHLFLGLVLALAMDAGTQAFAYDNSPAAAHMGDLFAGEEIVGNQELGSMRGGFIARNGMVIDFSFSASTLINGQYINQIVLNTADLATSADLLRRVIQVGEGNAAYNSGVAIDTLPNVLTVVQNNIDNLTIQQLNLLDLTVRNMNSFINRSVTPEIDFQNTLGLAP